MIQGVPSERWVAGLDAGRLMGYFGHGCASTDRQDAWKPLRGVCVRQVGLI